MKRRNFFQVVAGGILALFTPAAPTRPCSCFARSCWGGGWSKVKGEPEIRSGRAIALMQKGEKKKILNGLDCRHCSEFYWCKGAYVRPPMDISMTHINGPGNVSKPYCSIGGPFPNGEYGQISIDYHPEKWFAG